MKIENILAQERRARMAAERLLAQKQAELSDANRQLSLHARTLSEEIVETREDLQETKSENSMVKANLARATQETMIAKRRLWDSLETIEDGFAVFDQNECMIAANSAYLKPFDGLECIAPGISYVEILQAALDEGVVDIADMRPLAWRDMMLARWRAPVLEPYTLRLWDGTYIKLVDRRSGDGDTVSLGLNITDTIKYEAKLKEARTRAEAANRAKSAFLANMSHEIRTPMNGVVAIADLMAEGDLDEEQRLYVATIKKSGEALLTIINDVLDYSKIEAAKLTLHPEVFDLEAKVHDVVTLLLPSLHEKGLDMSVDFDIFMPTRVKGDPVRIGQILTNLLGNAVKFTTEGHVLIRVLGLPVDGGNKQKIHITVEDTGIGIPAEMQGHIFGEFNQVEDERNRKFDGTGLGLAITKQLITLMGGEIWVESEVGKGACFGLHITLPVEEEVVIPKLPLGLNKATLIMDDGLHLSILQKSLQALGVEVSCITHSGDLPDRFDSDHVIFIQDNLPRNTTQNILQTLNVDQPRVVLLTKQNAQSSTVKDFADKIDETLNMPILRQELFRTLLELDMSQNEPSPCPLSPTPTNNAITAISQLVAAPQDAPSSFETSREMEELVFIRPEERRPSPRPNDVPKSVSCDDDIALPFIPPATVDTQTADTASRSMRILAAEDNRTNQLVFSKLVKALDIDLRFANNGREALEMYQQFKPDLIFMDISMPDMDGKEATRCIRDLEEGQGLPRTKIVALTAHAMSGDAQEILLNGLDKHMTKPLKKPLIIDEIQAACPPDARPPLQED